MTSLVVCADAESPVVYRQDFEEKVGEEWSAGDVLETPKKHKALGPLLNDPVTLSLKELPAHRFLILEADLYIIRSWDGDAGTRSDGVVMGPDTVRIVCEERTWFESTFSNIPFKADVGMQSYPGPAGRERVAGLSGAVATGTLGYTFTYSGVGEKEADAVYRVRVLIPHRGATAKITFVGANLTDVDDESWAIDNISVRAAKTWPGADADVKQFTRLWEQLDGTAVEAWTAARQFVEAGPDAAKFLRQQLKRKDAPDVAGLIRQLDAESFAAREAATAKLKAMRPDVDAQLQAAQEQVESLEARLRLQRILGEADDGVVPPAARQTRAQWAIEMIERISTTSDHD